MFKKFLQKSENVAKYLNGGKYYGLINTDNTVGKDLKKAAQMLSEYENFGGNVEKLLSDDVKIGVTPNMSGIGECEKGFININSETKFKLPALHHEATHEKQITNYTNSKVGFDINRLNYAQFAAFTMALEADAYAAQAEFSYNNKGVKPEKNAVDFVYAKEMKNSKDSEKAYMRAFETFYKKNDDRKLEYELSIACEYARRKPNDVKPYSDKEFVELLGDAMGRKVDNSFVADITKNLAIPHSVEKEVIAKAQERKDDSYKKMLISYSRNGRMPQTNSR